MSDGADKKSMIMPATPSMAAVAMTVESIDLGPYTVELARPAKPDELLDLPEVAEAYAKDEYMPYWATLWPVARRLASVVATTQWAPGLTAIELGCGLGLPGVAALKAGMKVTFTDYDETALRFAADNARRNGGGEFELQAVDWRAPPARAYDVILASDLLYERRNVEPLVESFKTLIAPNGLAMVADQNRAFADNFRAALDAAEFQHISHGFLVKLPDGREVNGTIYLIRRS